MSMKSVALLLIALSLREGGESHRYSVSLPQNLDTVRTELRLIKAELQLLKQHREKTAGFYADFGVEPYGGVTLTKLQPVLFTRVLANTGNGYNKTTGIFTAPYSGLHIFSLHFMGGTHASANELAIYKGDQMLADAFAQGLQLDRSDQGSCTAVVHLLKGDQVSVKLFYGDTQIWGSVLTSFSGMLVHAD